MTPANFNKLANSFFDQLKEWTINPPAVVSNVHYVKPLHKHAKKAADFLSIWQHRDSSTTIDEKIERMRSVLVGKGNEYSTEGDKLWNFKAGAKLWEDFYSTDTEIKLTTPYEVACMYQLKHLCSIDDIVCGRRQADSAMLAEKFGDFINYECLKAAIATEMEIQQDYRIDHGN